MSDSSSRSLFVDWFRGLAILDMMLVHYSNWLDEVGLNVLGKFVRYTDFAVEGFVFVAGVMVGSRYLEKFRTDKHSVVKGLLRRVAGLVGVQYAMIITLSLPVALLVGSELTGADSVWQFAMKSFLFLNQVPLLHILPTFIPFFLLSIPLLYALSRGMDVWGGALSGALFVIGQWYPYLPVVPAESAIFPPMLWQAYFVAGVLAGKHESSLKKWLGRYAKGNLVGAIAVCLLTAFICHGHHLVPWWEDVRTAYGVVVRKFPLNLWGLLYHGSIVYLIMSVSIAVWGRLKTTELVHTYVGGLGRHSLAIFIGHVYVCFLVTYVFGHVMPVALALIVVNVMGSFVAVKMLDGRTAVPPLSSAIA